ncbi:MAG: acyltransferase, partial [Spirochaetaceae bacterium]|nr:acyltransferase [Spirochaetaceae bacterium]
MIQSLNGLRFIFAVIICCGHYIFTTPYAGEMTGKALFFDTTAAVAFFFILSGFSIACGFSDKMKDGTFEPLPFLKKRFFKLYPMHFL